MPASLDDVIMDELRQALARPEATDDVDQLARTIAGVLRCIRPDLLRLPAPAWLATISDTGGFVRSLCEKTARHLTVMMPSRDLSINEAATIAQIAVSAEAARDGFDLDEVRAGMARRTAATQDMRRRLDASLDLHRYSSPLREALTAHVHRHVDGYAALLMQIACDRAVGASVSSEATMTTATDLADRLLLDVPPTNISVHDLDHLRVTGRRDQRATGPAAILLRDAVGAAAWALGAPSTGDTFLLYAQAMAGALGARPDADMRIRTRLIALDRTRRGAVE